MIANSSTMGTANPVLIKSILFKQQAWQVSQTSMRTCAIKTHGEDS
jgi:hypothetical protein